VEVWLTTGNEAKKLSREADIVGQPQPIGGPLVVTVERQSKFQSMKGFGAALTNSAAFMLFNSPQRSQILDDLFGTNGIGLSYIRLVMGGSDFNAVMPYTYDDASYEDFNLLEFSIAKDLDFVIPVLRDILAVNPQVRIMASPWSAPAWMKSSGTLNGGQLKTGVEYLSTLAEFFVRFIRAYEAEGIAIDALTVQNEPEHSTTGYPTMLMPWNIERDLINLLGPRFQQEGITTQIIIWDHNWDATWYPINILNDATARQYVAGSAWHCYAGDKNGPVEVTSAHPDKDIYFTECSGGDWDTNFASSLGWNTQNLFIGQSRIGARTVLLWNLALDENHGPLVGASGCLDCRGVVTIYASTYDRNVEYYSLGQFSKFVKPDASHITSTTYETNGLESVAFENTDGSVVVVLLNTDWSNQISFQVLIDGIYYYVDNLPSRSVVTLVKRP
jgi:glucosylceramidase